MEQAEIDKNKIFLPSPSLAVPARTDGAFLHFLKEVPAWFILGLFVGAFLLFYQFSRDDFVPRLIDGLVGALLTSIVGQRPKSAPTAPTTNITADTVTTPEVNTDSIKDSTVNVESLNVENKEKE
jgi:hypothetical protein